MPVVSMKELLQSGVHFGHQTRRWNPKMKPYIFTERGGIYIIDLQKTSVLIDEAHDFLRNVAERGGHVLFVGTKKQCQDAIKEEAARVGMPYVATRWLGGLLTNFATLSKRIRRLHELRKLVEDGSIDVLPTREAMRMRGELEKLETNLSGVADMDRLPDAVFVIDPRKEAIVVREANKLKIPIVGLVDTNCDPDEITYVIAGNDDAIRSCSLIVRVVAEAVAEGKQKVAEAEFRAATAAAAEKPEPALADVMGEGEARPAEPRVTRPERPGVRSDRPPVRSDRPPVRSDRPPVRSDRPPARTDRPPVRSDRPPARSDRPGARPDRPPARTDRPAGPRPERPAPSREASPAAARPAEKAAAPAEKPTDIPAAAPAEESAVEVKAAETVETATSAEKPPEATAEKPADATAEETTKATAEKPVETTDEKPEVAEATAAKPAAKAAEEKAASKAAEKPAAKAAEKKAQPAAVDKPAAKPRPKKAAPAAEATDPVPTEAPGAPAAEAPDAPAPEADHK